MSHFFNQLEKYRKDHNMTQRQLLSIINRDEHLFTESHYSHCKSGRYTISLEVAEKIVENLGYSPKYFSHLYPETRHYSDCTSFQAALNDYLIRSNLTHEQLADLLGVGRTALTKWLNGRSAPRPSEVDEFAEILGLQNYYFSSKCEE